MKKALLIALVLLALCVNNTISAQEKTQYLEAKILEVNSPKKEARLEIREGDMRGKKIIIPFIDEAQEKRQDLKAGDQVIVAYTKQANREIIYIVDHVRRLPLFVLSAVFLFFVFVVGGKKGFFSLLGMAFSFLIIGQMIIPGIIAGTDPVVISLLGSLFIIPVTFYIAHGFNKHTTVAIVSTFIALIVTGVLAYIFVLFTRLTGYAADEAVYIAAFGGESINIRNLLLAGIIIGSMGILDDITISQTSVVEKLVRTNPKLRPSEVFKLGMEVGRDHIASLVNTLILVYAGASLPLFLLFYNTQMSYGKVINQEIIATEIVRTLVGSIGIISAVPITTFMASWITKKK